MQFSLKNSNFDQQKKIFSQIKGKKEMNVSKNLQIEQTNTLFKHNLNNSLSEDDKICQKLPDSNYNLNHAYEIVEIIKKQASTRNHYEHQKLTTFFKGTTFFQKMVNKNSVKKILHLIEKCAQRVEYTYVEKGQVVYMKEDKANAVYFIIQGGATVLVPKKYEQLNDEKQARLQHLQKQFKQVQQNNTKRSSRNNFKQNQFAVKSLTHLPQENEQSYKSQSLLFSPDKPLRKNKGTVIAQLHYSKDTAFMGDNSQPIKAATIRKMHQKSLLEEIDDKNSLNLSPNSRKKEESPNKYGSQSVSSTIISISSIPSPLKGCNLLSPQKQCVSKATCPDYIPVSIKENDTNSERSEKDQYSPDNRFFFNFNPIRKDTFSPQQQLMMKDPEFQQCFPHLLPQQIYNCEQYFLDGSIFKYIFGQYLHENHNTDTTDIIQNQVRSTTCIATSPLFLGKLQIVHFINQQKNEIIISY